MRRVRAASNTQDERGLEHARRAVGCGQPEAATEGQRALKPPPWALQKLSRRRGGAGGRALLASVECLENPSMSRPTAA